MGTKEAGHELGTMEEPVVGVFERGKPRCVDSSGDDAAVVAAEVARENGMEGTVRKRL